MSSAVHARSESLLEVLARLDCALTRDLSPSRFCVLAFQPSEWRASFLRWLFSQVEARLTQSTENLAQLSQPRLAHMASGLGLCPADRSDIILGSARRLDQLAFFERTARLLDFSASDALSSAAALSPIHSSDRSQEARAAPAKSPEELAGEMEASVELLNTHLSSEPLLRQLQAGPSSFLSADMGLLLRGRVEQRKAAGEAGAVPPSAWDVAQLREELEREERERPAVGVAAEFASPAATERQCGALERLTEASGRYAAAHERAFRPAVERSERGAPRRAELPEVAAFAGRAEALEGGLAAMAGLRSGVERVERLLAELEMSGTEVAPPSRKGLAREVLKNA